MLRTIDELLPEHVHCIRILAIDPDPMKITAYPIMYLRAKYRFISCGIFTLAQVQQQFDLNVAKGIFFTEYSIASWVF